MSERSAFVSSIFTWLLSHYTKSPACMATLIGLLSLVQPPDVYARDINLAEALTTIQKQEAGLRIVDVRTRGEYEEGHLPGAINMNIADPNFPIMLQELDKSAPVLIYCRTGRRSGIAVNILEGMGFTHVLHMKDGWIAWVKSNLPIERE